MLMRAVPNADVIQTVRAAVFDRESTARFAAGIIAVGTEPVAGLEDAYLGYLRLRAAVYADQTGMIPREQVSADGTESDADDARSVHFAVFENADMEARIVASMRLILKTQDAMADLPAERFFPDAFEHNPAPSGSLEISRYICRHENLALQSLLKWPLYAVAVEYAEANDLTPTFAVVEPGLYKGLVASRLPLRQLGAPKYIPEYSSENFPVAINTRLVRRMTRALYPQVAPAGSGGDFSYFDELGKGSEVVA